MASLGERLDAFEAKLDAALSQTDRIMELEERLKEIGAVQYRRGYMAGRKAQRRGAPAPVTPLDWQEILDRRKRKAGDVVV